MDVPREVRAGPLALLLEEAGIRYVRAGGLEILRRIYGAVRDPFWETAPTAVSNRRVEADGRSFRAVFEADCRLGPADFAWRGEIAGTPEGVLRFTFDGTARSTFLRNRIGLCVLHPARACAGRPCRVEHPDGSTETGRFPETISPHQPFRAIRAFAHEAAPGLHAEIRYEGDVFEMEDQRNWTDASFKTYSTPLDLPRPVEVPRGTRIRQTVILTLRGSPPPAPPPAPPVLAIGGDPLGPLPLLGLGFAAPALPREADLLRALRPAHLRVDLDLSGDFRTALRRAAEEARALGAGLELALHPAGRLPTGPLEELTRALEEAKIPATALVFDPDDLGRARRALGGRIPVGAGSDANFAELNRRRPPEGAADFLAYPACPQVHAFDDATLLENLEGQADTVLSARRFSGGRPVVVSPVTLRRRFNPHAPPGTPPPPPDPRQKTLFGAAWTLGSLKHLAGSGAARATYYETRGPRGLLEGDRVFPAYHVLADAAEFAGGSVLPARSSAPLALEGLALRKDGRLRILAANLTAAPLEAVLENLPGRIRVRRLNEEILEEAASAPERFRGNGGTPAEARGGRLAIRLSPLELLRIDGP